MVLPEHDVALIAKTLHLFESNGERVAQELYREVFKVDPDLRNLFSLSFLLPKNLNGVEDDAAPLNLETLSEPLSPQARILSDTIIEFASKVNNIEAFDQAIDRVCNKHVSRNVRPEHYTVVAEAFNSAMRSTFKERMQEEEYEAWNSAVMALARIFIDREIAIRKSAKLCPGGWEGWRKFVVYKKEDLGRGNVKLVLEASDGKPVSDARKGQFSCARVPVEEFGNVHCNLFLSSSDIPSETESTASPGSADKVSRGSPMSNQIQSTRSALPMSCPPTYTSSSPGPASGGIQNFRCPFGGLSETQCRPKSTGNVGALNMARSRSPLAYPHCPGTKDSFHVEKPCAQVYSSTVPAGAAIPVDVKQKAGSLAVKLKAPSQILVDCAEIGSLIELSVPVGGTAFIDMNEEGARRVSKKGGNPLLRQAQERNANLAPGQHVRETGGARSLNSNSLLRGFEKRGTQEAGISPLAPRTFPGAVQRDE